MPLTAVQIKNVKPTDKPQKLFDGNGLFLYVSPTGAKSFRLKYRVDGREKIYTIGLYPEVSLLDARENAITARRMLKAGVDPSNEKQKAKEVAGNIFSFEFVAREWHEKKKATWAERHAEDIMERMVKNLFPYIGKPHEEVRYAKIHSGNGSCRDVRRSGACPVGILQKLLNQPCPTARPDYQHGAASDGCIAIQGRH